MRELPEPAGDTLNPEQASSALDQELDLAIAEYAGELKRFSDVFDTTASLLPFQEVPLEEVARALAATPTTENDVHARSWAAAVSTPDKFTYRVSEGTTTFDQQTTENEARHTHAANNSHRGSGSRGRDRSVFAIKSRGSKTWL
ncbi:hypothetical protein SARC_05641 [Sphaeroforma arctica JP610]|uniref:Uncharacterized protein n=1 Tax=Sphaeroforma arctica JP610 TaxID=667725 RepID=A0A0L0FZP8_9EUKA|nr:hypothetical protein SARC_05641 [Sphaeroforma arctica JP610]KNC82069.1 hypothetical protein SARC_05641 [Sphaeroforma arctica JP610]|eukprot:XP_014155971.1 hypothetical protein SARC_05641 [Sphaeroforma arctica JP610]